MIRDMSLSQDMNALQNFKNLFPEAKLLISLREPVGRAYSAYCFSLTAGYQDTSYDFDDVLKNWQETQLENLSLIHI